jgi:arylsulfatase A-like enzyme
LPRRLAASAACGLLTVMVCAGCGQEPTASRPNVVVVLLDTARFDAVTDGLHRAETPFLDELRAGSAVFANTRSTSSWTPPATASLFTGLYPNEHGVIQGFIAHKKALEALKKRGEASLKLNALPEDIATLPELFRSNGYRTFGIAANINIGPEIGFSRGFDVFRRLRNAPANALVDSVAAWDPALTANGAPYFLYVHLNDAHQPYVAHDPWYRPVDGDEVEDARARYLSEISFVDQQLARLIDLLDLRRQGLLVIVSDHGEEFMDHGDTGHEPTLYRELNDVICLVHGPALGVEAGVHPDLVSLVDVLPTVLDLAELPAAEPVSGWSLAPLCLGGNEAAELNRDLEHRTVFAHRLVNMAHDDHMWAGMSGSWKLIQEHNGRQELFERNQDPEELRSLTHTDDHTGSGLVPALAEFRRRPLAGTSTEVSVPLDQKLVDKLKSLGYVR